MEKKMETTGIIGYIVVIWGLYWDNGKENGNYRDYRVYIGLYWGYIGGLYDTIPQKVPPRALRS